MPAAQLLVWRCIAITPRKWELSPLGELGGGFWVVAIFGASVIWYNDIEDGYNVSTYPTLGEIGAYGADQYELEHVLQQLINRATASVVQ
ncbi:hypothetical protein [Bosea beijingensis]|uniref:hypothetical protein n=1 Tax=Bosea beijingensis TaxID=3068632 RepID=UPI0027404E45|nr:hypothetical protein [Bosea sp. REN20]